jgi:protein-tyrosine phosphatase
MSDMRRTYCDTTTVFRPPVRVCFVCSGNICRSPTAEVALDRIARATARDYLLIVDSAGTGDWHAGKDMDARSRRTMVHAGYDVKAHAAKQFTADDFATRDLVVALDTGHVNALWWLAAQTDDVDAARAKLVRLRAFDPHLAPGEAPDVPDPYFGEGNAGFVAVLAQIERSCAALLDAIERAVVTDAERVVPIQQEDKPLL